jgi:hypothetical protein
MESYYKEKLKNYNKKFVQYEDVMKSNNHNVTNTSKLTVDDEDRVNVRIIFIFILFYFLFV